MLCVRLNPAEGSDGKESGDEMRWICWDVGGEEWDVCFCCFGERMDD